MRGNEIWEEQGMNYGFARGGEWRMRIEKREWRGVWSPTP